MKLEDRIRAAAQAAGDTVRPDSVPPLRLTAGENMTATAISQPGRRFRWIAPLAAAAAVIAVAVTAVTVSGATHAKSTTGGTTGVPSASGIVVPAVTGPDGVPPYYVALNAHGNAVSAPVYAVVRATATGRALGTIQPSVPGGTIRAVTAAAGDRTFVLDESKAGSGNLVGTRWFCGSAPQARRRC
jgi:hypothetical protein